MKDGSNTTPHYVNPGNPTSGSGGSSNQGFKATAVKTGSKDVQWNGIRDSRPQNSDRKQTAK